MTPIRWIQHLCAGELTAKAKAVGMALGTHATGNMTPRSSCSWTQLAGWTGLSRSTVARALLELEAAGYLSTVRTTRASGATDRTLYLLTRPEGGDEAREFQDQKLGSTPTASRQPRSDAARPRARLSLHRGAVLPSSSDLEIPRAAQPVDNPVDNLWISGEGVSHRHPPRVTVTPHVGVTVTPLEVEGKSLRDLVGTIADQWRLDA